MSDEPLYRIRQRGPGWAPMSSGEFFNSKYCDVPASEAENQSSPRGEWYCGNPECVVREVVVSCTLLDEEDKMPAAMKCPACRHWMAFLHWLRHETLVLLQPERRQDGGQRADNNKHLGGPHLGGA